MVDGDWLAVAGLGGCKHIGASTVTLAIVPSPSYHRTSYALTASWVVINCHLEAV